MADTAAKPVNRSGEELAMRALVTAELRRRHPLARIIHELPTRYSSNRIDVAAVNEDKIIAVEIKSSRDVIDRLEGQLRAFAPITTKLIVALAPKWNESLPYLEVERKGGGKSWHPQHTEAQQVIRSLQMPHIETWTCCAETQRIESTSGSYGENKHPWTWRAMDMLHNAELVAIAGRHRVACDAAASHDRLLSVLLDRLTGREAWLAVCRALRARQAFAAGTDAPILPGVPNG